MGLAHPSAEMGGAVEASCGPHPHKITNIPLGRGGGPRCVRAARLLEITLRSSRYRGEDGDWTEARAATEVAAVAAVAEDGRRGGGISF
eukprot:COSAG05_NODE_183_length_14758_cov_90.142506_2_plen_89_part_00